MVFAVAIEVAMTTTGTPMTSKQKRCVPGSTSSTRFGDIWHRKGPTPCPCCVWCSWWSRSWYFGSFYNLPTNQRTFQSVMAVASKSALYSVQQLWDAFHPSPTILLKSGMTEVFLQILNKATWTNLHRAEAEAIHFVIKMRTMRWAHSVNIDRTFVHFFLFDWMTFPEACCAATKILETDGSKWETKLNLEAFLRRRNNRPHSRREGVDIRWLGTCKAMTAKSALGLRILE